MILVRVLSALLHLRLMVIGLIDPKNRTLSRIVGPDGRTFRCDEGCGGDIEPAVGPAGGDGCLDRRALGDLSG